MGINQRTEDVDAIRIANYLRTRLGDNLDITINSVRDIDVKDINSNDFPMLVVHRISWTGYRCDKSKMMCKLILTPSAGNAGVRFNNLALAIHEYLNDFQYEEGEQLDIDRNTIQSSTRDINIADKACPALITTFDVTWKEMEGGLSWPGLD